jgi:hypothetical protein
VGDFTAGCGLLQRIGPSGRIDPVLRDSNTSSAQQVVLFP